jgi:hypothetical protein
MIYIVLLIIIVYQVIYQNQTNKQLHEIKEELFKLKWKEKENNKN